ncbi:MAG: glycerate kinase [Calditrichaeota bacterium]|nr:MAG: glycerate kinase [Calditrichota bacterium]
MRIERLRKDARDIFAAGLEAVDPKRAVLEHVRRKDGTLLVGNQSYDLTGARNVYVLGAGKASAAMAAAIEQILLDRISAGIVSVKYGHGEPLQKIAVREAGHPVPDRAGMQAALEMVDLLQRTDERDLVLCLLSGGGSALLPLPVDGISLEEKQSVTEKLLACGATIEEINAVRKHISRIKGGQLARLAFPAKLVSLILSDVVGDPLDAIASGPTVADGSTFAQAQEVLTRYDLIAQVPASVSAHIAKGVAGDIPETPKPGENVFSRIHNLIVANNLRAILAAKRRARRLGYNPLVLSTVIEGETREVARVHAAVAKEILRTEQPVARPACVLSGGETTVTLKEAGKGGRNQEFVLAAALEIAGLEHVVVLSGGTDGTDGPTDAAGAICDGRTVTRAEEAGLDARRHLREHNAYPFFEKLGDLLITGPTKTNVMDLRIILIGK